MQPKPKQENDKQRGSPHRRQPRPIGPRGPVIPSPPRPGYAASRIGPYSPPPPYVQPHCPPQHYPPFYPPPYGMSFPPPPPRAIAASPPHPPRSPMMIGGPLPHQRPQAPPPRGAMSPPSHLPVADRSPPLPRSPNPSSPQPVGMLHVPFQATITYGVPRSPPIPRPPMPPPSFLGRLDWEKGLAQMLANESEIRFLLAPKYGIRTLVYRAPDPTASAAAAAGEGEGGERKGNTLAEKGGDGERSGAAVEEGPHVWIEDTKIALDLGVVTITGGGQGEEGHVQEVHIPKGYEGAPAVVLSVSDHALNDDDNGHHHRYTGDMNVGREGGEEAGEEQHYQYVPPSRVTRRLRIINEAPGPYVIREVVIIPRDESEAVSWVEVEIQGWRYSSRIGERPEPTTEEAASKEVSIAVGKTDVAVTLKAQQCAEMGARAKWIMFRMEGPGVGMPYDMHVHSFVVARKAVGTVVDEAARGLLNVEARPFVPQALKEYFDPLWPVKRHSTDPDPFMPKMMAKVLERLEEYPLSLDFQILYDTYKLQRSFAEKTKDSNLRQDPYQYFGIVKETHKVVKYIENLQAMLRLEEAQATEDIRQYDLHGVVLDYKKVHHSPDAPLVTTINVPGAGEQRPRLEYGDEVRLRPAVTIPNPNSNSNSNSRTESSPTNSSMEEYRAAVIETREHQVKLWLPPDFDTETFPPTTRFHIRFCYDRYGYRFLHQALAKNRALIKDESAWTYRYEQTKRFIYPTTSMLLDDSVGEKNIISEEEMGWINQLINQEQKQAVADIVNRNHGLVPYLIFGPPGTGKTLTVIEAILQVCNHRPDAQILACAPSDTAADILCERLADHLKPQQLLRLNWWQRKLESIKPSLLKYSSWDQQQSLFSLPEDLNSICTRRVIVSTCATSGLLTILRNASIPLHFTHIFIDEASQALQPEVLVPLSLSTSTTSVILAGDPKQLGAQTRNPLVTQLGLAKSLHEHLMDSNPIYDVLQDRVGQQRCITMLQKNYRSHQAIIEVPSRLFYNRNLEQYGDERVINSMLGWEMLPGSSSSSSTLGKLSSSKSSGFPILFYGVAGTDYHDLDSPSFYNPVEASKIAELITALLTSKRVKCGLHDIAVISGFRKQVLKIRSLLRNMGLGAVNVGQVEDFQGQESKVTIISTVLSERHPSEMRECLGFLGSPKRFNVAITRAKALTIIVGSPFVLWHDTSGWKDLLLFAADHGAYRGCDCPFLRAQDVDDVNSLLDAIATESLLGKAAASEMYPTDLMDFFSDSPWRLLL